MKRKKLLIISHTEHYRNHNNEIVGWGSTINEISYLADYWEEIVHIGCYYKNQAPQSALPYTQSNVSFVPIPSYGGKSLVDKFMILVKIPFILKQVVKNLDGVTEVQLRLPTSMGLFLLPLFSFFIKRTFNFWVKYAGNWAQENPPISYQLQRWWLKKNFAQCKVTINGFWMNQPQHCYSFENPCLTHEDIRNGSLIANSKTFEAPFVFTFVGRLEDSKGVTRIIEALEEIPSQKIKAVHFIGDGKDLGKYKLKSSFLKEKVFFHGFLDKINVHEVLAESHFFLLPSASEGFPKVIAEAACCGVLPIVSDAGSISHYVNEENGFVWKINSNETFAQVVQNAINESGAALKKRAETISELAELFTFDHYYKKLNQSILGNNNRQ
ncbi:MAG: glycosyltransferase family 4 protein [Bacteroidota bacterium]